MSRIAFTVRTLAAAVTAIGLLVLLVLVWGLRPPIPTLSRSPTGPSALTVAEQIVDVIAWAFAVAVILRVLEHTGRSIARAELRGTGATAARLQRTLAWQPANKRRVSLVHVAATQPHQLVLRRSNDSSSAEHATQLPDPRPSPPVSESQPDAPDRSISILGPVKIEGARQRGRRLRSLTAQMLLYLALHAEGATVEKLADTLLPDTDPEQSRTRLWQSASEARRVLGDGFRRDDDGRYELDRGTVHIDIDELGHLLGGAQLSADQADSENLEAALSLFRGEPLASVDWTWAEGHARHLRATYVDMLEQVGRLRLERGDAHGALSLAEQGLNLDKLNEALWRLAMEAEFAIGLRDSLSRRYADLCDLLDRDLGLEPAGETRVLFHSLLGQG